MKAEVLGSNLFVGTLPDLIQGTLLLPYQAPSNPKLSVLIRSTVYYPAGTARKIGIPDDKQRALVAEHIWEVA